MHDAVLSTEHIMLTPFLLRSAKNETVLPKKKLSLTLKGCLWGSETDNSGQI